LSARGEALAAGGEHLIAVDAALRPLLAQGVVPDVVVTLDTKASSLERVFELDAGERARLTRTRLVYFPVAPPAVLEAWPGPRSTAYTGEERYAALALEAPRGVLFASGSVIHPAVDLAVCTGARRVELHGADFAMPGGSTHADGAAWQRAASATGPCVVDGHGGEVPSLANLVGYLRDLEAYIERHQEVEFVNTSRDGARIRGTSYREEERRAV
jgi:hypothetical protein